MSQFAWVPDFVLTESVEFKTLESPSENGTKQYRSAWPTGLQAWKLVFKKKTLTITQAILTFFNSMKGKATAFTWTNPLDSTEYTVRFKNDKLSFDFVSYQYCDFEIEIEEDTA